MGDIDAMTAERIYIATKRIGQELRELMKFKALRGLCTLGITCPHKAVGMAHRNSGAGCAFHLAAKQAGRRVTLDPEYKTAYAMWRDEERAKAREEKKAAAKKKPKLRAVPTPKPSRVVAAEEIPPPPASGIVARDDIAKSIRARMRRAS